MIFRNGQYDLLLFRFFFPLPSSTFKRSQLHNYAHTNTSTQMQTHKYKYTNTNTKIQIHKYKYTNKNTQLSPWPIFWSFSCCLSVDIDIDKRCCIDLTKILLEIEHHGDYCQVSKVLRVLPLCRGFVIPTSPHSLLSIKQKLRTDLSSDCRIFIESAKLEYLVTDLQPLHCPALLNVFVN